MEEEDEEDEQTPVLSDEGTEEDDSDDSDEENEGMGFVQKRLSGLSGMGSGGYTPRHLNALERAERMQVVRVEEESQEESPP